MVIVFVTSAQLQDSLSEATIELDKQRMLLENAQASAQELEEEVNSLKTSSRKGGEIDEAEKEITRYATDVVVVNNRFFFKKIGLFNIFFNTSIN